VLDGCEHGGIISAEGRQVPEARAVYTRILTAANILLAHADEWRVVGDGNSGAEGFHTPCSADPDRHLRPLGQKEAPATRGFELEEKERGLGRKSPTPHQKRKAGRVAGLSASPAAFSG
jgi:hypothetical protein